MINKNDHQKEYKVKGYTNRWGVIDSYRNYVLLENNTWGDETFYLIVDINAKVEDKEYTLKSTGEKIVIPTIMEVIGYTYDDLETALEQDYDLI